MTTTQQTIKAQQQQAAARVRVLELEYPQTDVDRLRSQVRRHHEKLRRDGRMTLTRQPSATANKLSTTVRAKPTSKTLRVSGYAAVFYREGNPDTEYVLWDDAYGKAVERIMPGAFTEALKRRDDVRLMFNHADFPLARTVSGTLQLQQDSIGLFYKAELDRNSPFVANIESTMRRGDVNQSSFAFSIPPGGQEWRITTGDDGKEKSIREISTLELFDVSIVGFAAYRATTSNINE